MPKASFLVTYGLTDFYSPLKAGGRRASALGGGSTTPTGMQSSIKSFFGKEVSDIIVGMKGERVGAY